MQRTFQRLLIMSYFQFDLSAYEVIDVSSWEQHDIIVGYVKDSEPIEKLLEFVPCEDINGRFLCNYLVKKLQDSD